MVNILKMFQRVVVGISGGVDSAVAALLLKRKGYDVCGVFMQNWDIADETGVCRADEDYKDAAFVCKKLNVPLHRVNFVKEYWNNVFSELLKAYQNGETPNPDVLCNKFVKFDQFYQYAVTNLNADAIATGHYARTNFGTYLEDYDPNKLSKLLIPKDAIKDQTLFLCQIKQNALRKTMFPLGELTKPEVKNIARENGLSKISKKKESMGICFIGTRNFQKFISQYVVDKPGNFVSLDTGKIVGHHKGIHHWTLGQRSKISGVTSAYFIAKKDKNTNDIFVTQGTDSPKLFNDSLYTAEPHWISSPPQELTNGEIFACDFKFQHVDNVIACLVCKTSSGLVVLLKKPLRSLTPGQFAVFYKNDECLGSAEIVNPGPSMYSLLNFDSQAQRTILSSKEKLFETQNRSKNNEINEHFEMQKLIKQANM